MLCYLILRHNEKCGISFFVIDKETASERMSYLPKFEVSKWQFELSLNFELSLTCALMSLFPLGFHSSQGSPGEQMSQEHPSRPALPLVQPEIPVLSHLGFFSPIPTGPFFT